MRIEIDDESGKHQHWKSTLKESFTVSSNNKLLLTFSLVSF